MGDIKVLLNMCVVFQGVPQLQSGRFGGAEDGWDIGNKEKAGQTVKALWKQGQF